MAWPPAEFAAYMHRASKAMAQLPDGTPPHQHGKALAYRFASLLEHDAAEPVPGCPSKACRREFPGLGAWSEAHTAAQLRAHIVTAEDEVFADRVARAQRLHDWVVAWVGWGKRRGDVIRSWRKARWLGMRTK